MQISENYVRTMAMKPLDEVFHMNVEELNNATGVFATLIELLEPGTYSAGKLTYDTFKQRFNLIQCAILYARMVDPFLKAISIINPDEVEYNDMTDELIVKRRHSDGKKNIS